MDGDRLSASYPFLFSFDEVAFPNIDAQRITDLENRSPIVSMLVCCLGCAPTFLMLPSYGFWLQMGSPEIPR